MVGDMCTFGMKHGDEYVRKPTAFMTNAPCIAEALDQRCTTEHRHAPCCEKIAKEGPIGLRPKECLLPSFIVFCVWVCCLF